MNRVDYKYEYNQCILVLPVILKERTTVSSYITKIAFEVKLILW